MEFAQIQLLDYAQSKSSRQLLLVLGTMGDMHVADMHTLGALAAIMCNLHAEPDMTKSTANFCRASCVLSNGIVTNNMFVAICLCLDAANVPMWRLAMR